MLLDKLSQDVLLSLVLRITLGAIFLAAGLGKVVGSQNDLGTCWAEELWDKQSRPPQELMTRLDNLPGQSPQIIEQVKEQLIVAYAQESGYPPPIWQFHAAQLVVAWGEVLGAIALLAGVLTRLAAGVLVVLRVAACVTASVALGSFATAGGIEYNLTLAALCLALVVLGGGALSVDRLWSAGRPRRQAVHGGLESGLFTARQAEQPLAQPAPSEAG